MLRSCVIAPVRSRSGELIGGIVVAHTEPGRFTADGYADARRHRRTSRHRARHRAAVPRGRARDRGAASRRGDPAVPRRDERAVVVVARLSRELRAPRAAVRSVPRRSLPHRRRRRAAGFVAGPRCTPMPSRAELVGTLETRFAPDPFGAHPAASVVRGGQSEMAEEMADEFLRATTRSEEHYRVVKALDFTSYMCVPLTARGRNLGALTLVSAGSGRHFDRDDLALAEELARRAGPRARQRPPVRGTRPRRARAAVEPAAADAPRYPGCPARGALSRRGRGQRGRRRLLRRVPGRPQPRGRSCSAT